MCIIHSLILTGLGATQLGGRGQEARHTYTVGRANWKGRQKGFRRGAPQTSKAFQGEKKGPQGPQGPHCKAPPTWPFPIQDQKTLRFGFKGFVQKELKTNKQANKQTSKPKPKPNQTHQNQPEVILIDMLGSELLQDSRIVPPPGGVSAAQRGEKHSSYKTVQG